MPSVVSCSGDGAQHAGQRVRKKELWLLLPLININLLALLMMPTPCCCHAMAAPSKITLHQVVDALGRVGDGRRLSVKKAQTCGGALQKLYPGLTGSAASSLASHMRRASLEDNSLELDEILANVEHAFPGLKKAADGAPHPAPKKKARAKGGGHDRGYGGSSSKPSGARAMSMAKALAAAA